MSLLADRYELVELLGSGGMARVHAATDQRLQRPVAVKLIRDELLADDTARSRLLHEARAAAAFQHPAVVTVFDVGEDDAGRPFIVMERVDGETLANRLARDGALPPADVAAVGIAVLDALAAAHRRGLVHRDLKPANVLLPAEDGVKLADFGIAKGVQASASRLTATGNIVGTPAYLSPEQAAGHHATPRSDLYGCGVLLYEALTGAPPFTGDDPVAVAIAHQQMTPPPVTDAAPDVPPALSAVVARALAKEPDDRFADAEEMRAALAEAAEEAGPPRTVAIPATTVSVEPPRAAPLAVDRGHRPARWAIAGAVVAAVTLLGALSLIGGEEPGESAGEVRTPISPGPDGADGDATSDEADGSGQDPASLEDIEGVGDLAALLARDPGVAGERGTDLLGGLVELQNEDRPAARRERARELLMDVRGWISEDDLRSDVGRTAISVLEAAARPEAEDLAEVSRLLADVAAHQPQWGDRAEELADGLANLLDEDDPDDRAQDAADLIDDLTEWTDDDEIDGDGGDRAIAVLQPLADDADDGAESDDEDDEDDGRGDDHPGEGRGRGGRGPPGGRGRGS